MNLFVAEMLRWGSVESHHYIIGVFDSIEAAEKACEEERERRGGKYESQITDWDLNKKFIRGKYE